MSEERILEALREGVLSGYELGVRTKMWSGHLYPLLFKMEEAGKLESRWEQDDPPRRRLYRIPSEPRPA